MSYTSRYYGNQIDEGIEIALGLDVDNLVTKSDIDKIEEDITHIDDTLLGVQASLNGKVDKVDGLGLSENSFTDEEKEKLAGLENYNDTEIRDELETKAAATSVYTKAEVDEFIYELEDEVSVYGDYSSSLYVDSVNGDDENSGASGSPLRTLEKAIQEAAKRRSCIVNLAEGTYDTAGVAIEVRGFSSISLRGAGIDSTIIQGRFNIDRGAWVTFQNLTISGAPTTANGCIYLYENGQTYINACKFSPSAGYCVHASSMSRAYFASCNFSGTPSNIGRVYGGALLHFRTCETDLTSNNKVLVQNGGELHLDGSPELSATQSGTGRLYIDGVQTAPTA